MNEENKTDTKRNATTPDKSAPEKKTFELFRKCRCNSDNAHSLGEYFIVDEQQDDEVSNKLIVKKIDTKKDGATPEENREDKS